MNGGLLTFLGTAFVAIAGIGGAWITARGPRKASPYEALAARVVDLEQQRGSDLAVIGDLQRTVDVVIDDRDALVRYVVLFREWVALGAKPPAPPVPQHLRDFLPSWPPEQPH